MQTPSLLSLHSGALAKERGGRGVRLEINAPHAMLLTEKWAAGKRKGRAVPDMEKCRESEGSC